MHTSNRLHPRRRTALVGGGSVGRWALLCALGLFLSLLASGVTEAQEKRHLRHILVKNEAMADALLKELGKGAEFKELARKYSLDPGNRVLGGDLGWAAPAEFDDEFARVAFAIENKGDHAKVHTRFGWHVIEYVDSKPAPGVAPPPPKDPEPEKAKPATPPPTMADRNSDIAPSLSWDQIAFGTGEQVRFSITLENTTDQPLEVWNPKLWPMGLLVRYQFSPNNPDFAIPSDWENGEPPGGFLRTLAPGEALREQFVLQDYFGECPDWPILRIIWRGDVLHRRLQESYPTLVEDPSWPKRSARWRFYISEESRVSILPQYEQGERWFLCLYSRGKTWIEIHDPGVPNLIDEFFDDVRHEVYTDALISEFVAGDHFACVPEDDDLPVGFSQPGLGIEWRRGTVGLGLTWDGRVPQIGSSLAIGLGNPMQVAERAVPIGRVVHQEGTPIEMIESALESRQLAKISLALLYPASLAPAAVVEAADAMPDPGRLRRKIDPTPKKEWSPQLMRNGEREKVPEKVPDKSTLRGEPGPVAKDSPRVEIRTSAGAFVVQLFEDDAPNTVANFIALAESDFYDGTHVVRKVSTDYNRGFVQLGSPDDTIQGHPGFTIEDEVHQRRHLTGVLSMARKHTVPNSAGCQFFICLEGQPQLDQTYTTFGQIIQGLEVVDKLTENDTILDVRVLQKRPHEYKPLRMPIPGN